MITNNNPYEVAMIVITIAFFFSAGLVLALHPRAGVKLLGRILRLYRRTIGVSDEHLEGMMLPGTRELFRGNLAQFLQDSQENPDKYQALISYVRAVGILISGVIAAGLVLVLLLSVLAWLSPFIPP
ncbi:MAG: hypothetical protein ACOYZ7_19980 [Chloroflexota bacterium]